MIFSTGTEQALNQIQHPFIIKMLNKLDIGRIAISKTIKYLKINLSR